MPTQQFAKNAGQQMLAGGCDGAPQDDRSSEAFCFASQIHQCNTRLATPLPPAQNGG